MSDDMGILIEKIRKKVFAEADDAFAAGTFQQWRYAMYNGRMPDADATACFKCSCGESMEMYLKIRNNRIEKASYVTDSCGSSSLCGSYAAEMAIGMSLEQVLDINAADLLKRAGKTGRNMEKSALFAVKALHEAVNKFQYQNNRASSQDQFQHTPRFIANSYGAHHMRYTN